MSIWTLRDHASKREYHRGTFADCALHKEMMRQEGWRADDLEIVRARPQLTLSESGTRVMLQRHGGQ